MKVFRIIPGIICFIIIVLVNITTGAAQTIRNIEIDQSKGLSVVAILLENGNKQNPNIPVSLFSLEINNEKFLSGDAKVIKEGELFRYQLGSSIQGNLEPVPGFEPGWKAVLTIKNISVDTIEISNVVPFGAVDDHIYITGTGQWALARTKIFRPGFGPVGVILPDNAWEMGYGSIELGDNLSACAIARRTSADDSQKHRYKTVVPPRGNVEYTIYADVFKGDWQNGMQLMFQDRYLYDLESFDNSLYEREDLKWIRDKYIITLQFAWDHNYYDRFEGKYNFFGFLEEGKKYFGGYDVFGLWPTWPRLGIDERSQWDLYEDMPLGLDKIKELARYAQSNSTKFFIEYNPWDKSTREEDPYEGMARLIRSTGADGVVLDCHGSSSKKLQEAADGVKEGVIMYSEGMAVPKDMPGIISGRVHDAIFMPPPLNLNKLIKPEFAIFRVCQLSRGRIHREVAISFFNGYGTELNTFAPGRPGWMEEDYRYLGRTTMILRQNSSVFLNDRWRPLIPTVTDSVWVNRWQNRNKTLYTIFSLIPEGVSAPLFKVVPEEGYHFVSLWNHEALEPVKSGDEWMIPVKVKAFNKGWLNSRREGNVDCVARLPDILGVSLRGDSLFINSAEGKKILVWKGDPSYEKKPVEFEPKPVKLKISEIFGRYEGKVVIQLFDEKELMDEVVVGMEPGKPWLISEVKPTKPVKRSPAGMEEIGEGDFEFLVTNPDQFIPYPDYSRPRKVHIDRFFMDKYPVTNSKFYEFLESSGYQPEYPANFMKHWENNMYVQGQANYPVVWVSIEDARAYAEWAGKRLPTEIEWQYAAQGTDGRLWPWGDTFHGTKCNNAFGRPTPVNTFPKGKSPFKVMDMVGNVWQLTDDVYDNGSYYFVIIRGGSYYKPASSWWYVQGGPQQLDKTQMLLMVSPGFDRNATVGFRCVKDAK